MRISLSVFLIDEYMETTVTSVPQSKLLQREEEIKRLCSEVLQYGSKDTSDSGGPFAAIDASDTRAKGNPKSTQNIIAFLRNFIRSIKRDCHADQASANDLLELRSGIEVSLRSHLTQLIDNKKLSSMALEDKVSSKLSINHASPLLLYHRWVHTTGSGHVDALIGLAQLICHMSPQVRGDKDCDCFPTVTQKLQAYNMNVHLSAFCRMHNDYGSVNRDRREANLKSLDFQEFSHSHQILTKALKSKKEIERENNEQEGEKVARQTLLTAAKYERRCAEEIEREVGGKGGGD